MSGRRGRDLYLPGMKLFGLSLRSYRQARQDAEELAYYKDKYRLKVGGTSLLRGFDQVNYRLLSPNGGRDWYVLDDADAIVGPVEEVYPGLLDNLAAMDSLVRLAESGAPVDPATAAGAALLRHAGFEVTKGCLVFLGLGVGSGRFELKPALLGAKRVGEGLEVARQHPLEVDIDLDAVVGDPRVWPVVGADLL